MVASMVAQCKCLGDVLVRDLQVYHGRLVFPLDYQPGKSPTFIRSGCEASKTSYRMHSSTTGNNTVSNEHHECCENMQVFEHTQR